MFHSIIILCVAHLSMKFVFSHILMLFRSTLSSPSSNIVQKTIHIRLLYMFIYLSCARSTYAISFDTIHHSRARKNSLWRRSLLFSCSFIKYKYIFITWLERKKNKLNFLFLFKLKENLLLNYLIIIPRQRMLCMWHKTEHSLFGREFLHASQNHLHSCGRTLSC
jgi:hypothetical protein